MIHSQLGISLICHTAEKSILRKLIIVHRFNFLILFEFSPLLLKPPFDLLQYHPIAYEDPWINFNA